MPLRTLESAKQIKDRTEPWNPASKLTPRGGEGPDRLRLHNM